MSEAARFPMNRSQLDALLFQVVEAIQLDDTRRERAESAYRGVGAALLRASATEHLDPDIHPQGSMLHRTTVRPIRGGVEAAEFDLDLVCLLNISASSINPMAAFKLVWDGLGESKEYAWRREAKKRCVRLTYADDFHLDVLPAVPDPARGEFAILVPDRELRRWSPSNPRGFGYWLDFRAHPGHALHFASRMRPLPPPPDPSEPNHLRNCIQLAKRQRDVEFPDPEHAPRSIVLTTLLGMVFRPTAGSLISSFIDCLAGIETWAEQQDGTPVVPNPANPDENFAESWIKNPTSFARFKRWVRTLRGELEQMLQLSSFEAVSESLKRLFGEKPACAAIERHLESLRTERRAGSLRATRNQATLITSSTAALHPAVKTSGARNHTLFGGPLVAPGLVCRPLGIREHAARLRMVYPSFSTRVSGNRLTVRGSIVPRPCSETYAIEIVYIAGRRPIINVLHPTLRVRPDADEIPHLHRDGSLCVYYPGEWTPDRSIGELIPSVSWWLANYEVWHATGTWVDVGIHPGPTEQLGGTDGR